MNKEEILLQVDVQTNTNRLVELTGELRKAKAEYAALQAAQKAGKITAEELDAATVKYRATLAANAQETRVLTKANEQQIAVNLAAKGSNEQLRAQLALATTAYNKLSVEERENTAAGQRLQAQTKALSDALKANEGAVNDNRRQVGSYKQGIVDAIKESGFFGGTIEKVTEAQEGFSKAQGIAKAAIGGNVTALGFLRLALIATGLGALVVVLGSVVAFLTRTQEGTDLVSRKFAGLKAVVSTVIGAAAEFGAVLFKALENPKQAITDLVAFIQGNLLNRLKAFAIIFDGITSGSINKVSAGLFQLSTGVTDVTGKLSRYTAELGRAAEAGERIEAESQRILRSERELNVERSQSRARIEELKKASEDSTKSVAVRSAAAKEAAAIENQLLARQLALQDERIKNELAGQKLRKVVSGEDLDRLAELRAARADTAQESFGLQTELQNKINGLTTEGAALAETARKKLDDARLKSIEGEMEATEAREAAAAQFLASEDAGRVAQLAKDEQARVDKLAADRAAYDQAITMLERHLEGRRVANESAFAEGETGKADYEAVLNTIEEGGFAARVLLAKEFNQDIAKADQDRLRFQNRKLLEQTDKEQEQYQSRLAVAEDFGASIGALYGETLGDANKTLEDFAKQAIVLILGMLEKQVLAAQAAATVASLTQADSIATGGATGLLRAAVINGLIVAAFAAAKAGIQAFATGGVVQGQGNQDNTMVLTTPGEVVMNKKASTEYKPLLSYLNVLSGGSSFSNEAPRLPRQLDGGLGARSAAAGAFPTAAEIGAAVAANVPTEIGVSNINNAQARHNRVRAVTSLTRRT